MFYATLLYLVLVHVGILWIRLSQPLFVPVPTPYKVGIFIFNYLKWEIFVRFVAISEIVCHHCLNFPFMSLLSSQSIKYYHSMKNLATDCLNIMLINDYWKQHMCVLMRNNNVIKYTYCCEMFEVSSSRKP